MELVTPEDAENVFRELESRGVADLKQEGISPDGARFERELDVRYTGQGYELRVSLEGLGGGEGFKIDDMEAARNRFDDQHAKIHGHAAKDRSLEIVSYRVRLRVSVPKYEPIPSGSVIETSAPADSNKGTRTVYFAADEATETKIYERDKLPFGAWLDGPAIVEQFDSTIVVPESWVGRIDGYGNLILSREE
jgi:N-methylhydantoinase A